MNLELALCTARTWALDYLRGTPGDVEVVVPLRTGGEGEIGPVARRFLRETPQECASLRMQWWSGSDRGDAIVYTRVREDEDGEDGSGETKKSFVLRIFEGETCACAALYHPTGERLTDQCLVMWDKGVCDLCNLGYAPGRCPDTI